MAGAESITRVAVEAGRRRTFASAVDWPGWSRGARTESEALALLARYASRYAAVTEVAGSKPPPKDFQVIERVPGNATTDFGVPAMVMEADRVALDEAEARRLLRLLDAAWTVYDRVVARAPLELRKGPRGGGRDRDKIQAHVEGAEAAYLPKIGQKVGPKIGRGTGRPSGGEAVREAFREGLRSGADLGPWPLRYAVRRVAWHVLDHAWEIEDRTEPAA